jgi:hypothetical protein
MYIIPVIETRKSGASDHLRQFWVFLERNGTHLIETEAADEATAIEAAQEFFAENELSPAAEPFCVGDLVFAPVDATDKDLAAFYTWAETPPGTTPSREAWRPFLWASSPEDKDPWGVNKLLDEITLSGANHTAFSIFKAYLFPPLKTT